MENTETIGILIEAERLLGRGEPARARDLLAPAVAGAHPPAAAFVLFARAVGQTDSFEAGMRILDARITVRPDERESLRARIELLMEAGRYREAATFLTNLRDLRPDDTDLATLALDLAELGGDALAAETLLENLLGKLPDDPGLLERASAVLAFAAKRRTLDAEIAEIRCDTTTAQPAIPIDREFLDAFVRQFAGREGVHAVQAKGEKGAWGYRPVKEPLDTRLVSKHLAGDATLGTYLVRRDDTTCLMAFDLDIAKPALRRFDADPTERRRLKLKLVEEGKRLLAAATEAEVPLLPEWSGHKGLHFWVFTDEPVPARILRAVGRWLLDRVPPPTAELHWELFPKQDHVEPDGLGNLVKLPLGIHRRSMKRSLFLDPVSFRPADDQARAFFTHRRLDRPALGGILGRMTLSGKDTELPAMDAEPQMTTAVTTEEPPGATGRNDGRSDPALSLEIVIPLPKRFPESIEAMFAGCRLLGAVVSRVLSGATLSGAERHVLVYLLAPLGDDGRICLHQLLNRQPGYDPNGVNREIRAVPPNPMSCSRTRHFLPAQAAEVGCDCQFRVPEGCYASPVVLSGFVPGFGSGPSGVLPAPAPVALSQAEEFVGASGGIDRMMREYLEVRETVNRLKARLKMLRGGINTLFDKAGTDRIVTKIGEYTRLPDPTDESEG
ncbi:MAG TPA: CRISPR-associated primase-polymerase type A1 [Candidatus Ozemobacteraceae bacterium]|nr:CRISPR-associated primase-polymerase type A1 [Candidatus Ozemobacteraceae bacterium]